MSPQLTASAEAVEAEFMFHYESMALSPTKATLGIATARMGGGVVLSMRNDVTGYWSKALGFGFAQPVTSDLIASVVEFYRAEDCPAAVIQIAPEVLPSDRGAICLRYNIHADSFWVKMACRIDEFRAGQTALRVGPVGDDSVSEWASVTMRGFGMPEEGLVDMMVASAANPDFRPFAVWDGDRMVAAANLYIRGDVASLNAAATLPDHRNRGAQSALLAARATEAANAGCGWLVAEAAQPEQGSTNPSLNNMVRSGFRPLYSRRNWTWRSV